MRPVEIPAWPQLLTLQYSKTLGTRTGSGVAAYGLRHFTVEICAEEPGGDPAGGLPLLRFQPVRPVLAVGPASSPLSAPASLRQLSGTLLRRRFAGLQHSLLAWPGYRARFCRVPSGHVAVAEPCRDAQARL